ncbi:MAG TPA: hypothetical protein DET40_18175 [Lentisphaeria bacterium]|nr:MAG: hypothetical protein A2X45_24975 [Lentisphaerae bacterium GWF2_50_93]HCE45471.1 hypothetical protein [Lentisphaeria bacterium]
MIAVVHISPTHQTGVHAEKELVNILRHLTGEQVRSVSAPAADARISISLSTDSSLHPQEIMIDADPVSVEIKGGSEGAVLHAVYTFAEKFGCVFEFSGILFPEKKEVLEMPELHVRHIPGMPNRGIRMHLNFVQDQSFFTEKEFAGFIDNMARQKFNYLLFHMYTPQQWFPFEYRGIRHLDLGLGNLNRKPLAEDMIGRSRVKVKEHWFPQEFEQIRDNEELLKAVYGRYKSMMSRAHARGIRNSVSFEPESMPQAMAAKLPEWTGQGAPAFNSSDALTVNWQEEWSGVKLAEPDIRHPLVIDIAVERVLQCIDAFPELDELQLISREGVAWRPKDGATYADEIARLCRKFEFAAEVFDSAGLGRTVPAGEGPEMNLKAHPYWTVPPGDNFFPTVIGSLRYIEFSIAILKDPRVQAKLAERKIEAEIAVYSPNPETIRLMMPPLAKMLPKGIRFSCLADYGARDIADNLPSWKPLADAGHRIGVISWLEFDGTMMLAQSWLDSLVENVRKAKALGAEVMSFNHWRVRSLEHNAAAAAGLCWDPSLTADEFKDDYFGRMFGKENADLAKEAYGLLEEATIYAKTYNYNIGFTTDWVFRNSTDIPGYYWRRLMESKGNYQKALDVFRKLEAVSIRTGRKQAAYMRDYCQMTVWHVDAVHHLQNAKLPLMGYKAWPVTNERAAWPAPEILKVLVKEADKALALEIKYMRVLSRWVKSCDEQGQLSMHHQGVIEPLTSFAKTLSEHLEDGAGN